MVRWGWGDRFRTRKAFSSKIKITVKKVYIMFVAFRIPAGNRCPFKVVTKSLLKGLLTKGEKRQGELYPGLLTPQPFAARNQALRASA